MNNEIKGISCVVKNCIHHDSSDCCTADHIEVGNQSATNTTETNCCTFECNSGCNCK